MFVRLGYCFCFCMGFNTEFKFQKLENCFSLCSAKRGGYDDRQWAAPNGGQQLGWQQEQQQQRAMGVRTNGDLVEAGSPGALNSAPGASALLAMNHVARKGSIIFEFGRSSFPSLWSFSLSIPLPLRRCPPSPVM